MAPSSASAAGRPRSYSRSNSICLDTGCHETAINPFWRFCNSDNYSLKEQNNLCISKLLTFSKQQGKKTEPSLLSPATSLQGMSTSFVVYIYIHLLLLFHLLSFLSTDIFQNFVIHLIDMFVDQLLAGPFC